MFYFNLGSWLPSRGNKDPPKESDGTHDKIEMNTDNQHSNSIKKCDTAEDQKGEAIINDKTAQKNDNRYEANDDTDGGNDNKKVNGKEIETEDDDKDHDKVQGNSDDNDDNNEIKGDGDNNCNNGEIEGAGQDKATRASKATSANASIKAVAATADPVALLALATDRVSSTEASAERLKGKTIDFFGHKFPADALPPGMFLTTLPPAATLLEAHQALVEASKAFPGGEVAIRLEDDWNYNTAITYRCDNHEPVITWPKERSTPSMKAEYGNDSQYWYKVVVWVDSVPMEMRVFDCPDPQRQVPCPYLSANTVAAAKAARVARRAELYPPRPASSHHPKDASPSSKSVRSQADPSYPNRILLAFDEAWVRQQERSLRTGEEYRFQDVISHMENSLKTRLSKRIKEQLKLNDRMDQLMNFEIKSSWGFTETVVLETDTEHWVEKEYDGITYRFGISERGQKGKAAAATSDGAKKLAKINAREEVYHFVIGALEDVLKLSKKKPADLSEKKSEEKKWWPMGDPPKPTQLGQTSMMLFSGDVIAGYGDCGFEENCKQALQHLQEVPISKRRTFNATCPNVHDWAIAFTQCLNDPEEGGAKTCLAQHAMKLVNTDASHQCLSCYKETSEDGDAFLALNVHTSQYLAAIQVLGNLSSVDKHQLAYKRQNQAVGLHGILPAVCQPNRVLNYAVFQPMLVLGQSAEEVLSAILPTDADRKAYDFSEKPQRAPNLNPSNKAEYNQAWRTFESTQRQNRMHNNQAHILSVCAVGKGSEQRHLWRKFLEERRAGKTLCRGYSYCYPEKQGQALLDVIVSDIKLNPEKNSDELCDLAHTTQKRKYLREMKKNKPGQKNAPVLKNKKRKRKQEDTPKKAKKARKNKNAEEKEINPAEFLPPAKTDSGDYTTGGAQWVRCARESLILLQRIANDVGLALNETDRKVPDGYSKVEVRSEIFSGTTLVGTLLTSFDSIGSGELEKLLHVDCLKFAHSFGLVNPKEFKNNGEACSPQQIKESLRTWMKPNELQALSWQSALVAKFFRNDGERMLRRNKYSPKALDIIRRIKAAVEK